jgi:hypothetical protein
MSRTLPVTACTAALLLCAGYASAKDLTVTLELPRLNVAEYHRPYLAIWVERGDQSVAANLALWYEIKNKNHEKWVADLRQWWRRSGREQTLPVDGITGATRPAGQYQLVYAADKAPLATLAPGRYQLVVEAVREVGGREVLKVPFEWPVTAATTASAKGSTELAAVKVDLNP